MPSKIRVAMAARFIFAIAIAICSVHAIATHVAKTDHGLIIGHPAANISSVTEYLGIPYAQPPIGDLRFAPPARLTRRRTYEAAHWGFDCPQTPTPPRSFPGFSSQAQRILNYFAAGTGTPQSEDCLTLNVWANNHQNPRSWQSEPKAVLVFFYGGRFTIGNTDTPFYNGQFLAHAEDIIIVTVNYRLNIFGFPGAPNQPQNLALRDQRLAVEWVRDNIGAFGGDSRKITILGQSSGAVAVDYWSYAYSHDPIVAGLISDSGNALSFPMNPANTTLNNWYNVSATLGCGDSGDTLPCMRRQNWTNIKDAAAGLPSISGGSPFRAIPPFWPSVDNETVFSDYKTLATEGRFAKLPYLLGNNQNEQGFYVLAAYARGINTTTAQGDQFLLQSFTCPNSFEARSRKAHGVPVWQYRYFGDWANLRLYPTSGAYHGTELEMVFGNSAGVSGIPDSESERQTSSLLQRAWAAFVRDPAEGLKEIGWPEFDPECPSLIRLAYDNEPEATFVKPGVYDAACMNVTLGALQ